MDKVSKLGKFTGLMFKSRNTKNLLFEFENYETIGIHSLFVFFPFLAVWLDKKNKVTDLFVVKPFTLIAKPKNPSRKLVEIPFNERNKNIINFFVGKRKI